MSSRIIDREELYMEVAKLYAKRGTCNRAKVGVVAVREGRVIATGYNGSPSGRPHCIDVGCMMEGDHCIRTTHAEANLISWAARLGTKLEGSTMYCTHEPCFNCVKLILNAGIVEFVYLQEYGSGTASDWMGLTIRAF